MDDLLSIVIPTYNRKNCLFKTLKSLENQTFKDFEVIISDDGSTDGTGDLINSFNWPFKLNYFWHPRKGRSFSRNFGVNKSKGSLILFLDDHIILDKNCLREHFLSHQKYSNSPYKIIRGKVFFLEKEEDLNFFTHFKEKKSWRQIFDEQNPWVTFFTSNTSLTKSAFEKVGGFDENFTEYGFEDNELGYRLKKAGYKFKINDKAVGYVFPYESSFEDRLKKAREVGHMAVIFARKYPKRKYLVGVNFFNWLVYKILKKLKLKNFFEAGYQKALQKNVIKKQQFYEFWLKHYNFLEGIEEAKGW